MTDRDDRGAVDEKILNPAGPTSGPPAGKPLRLGDSPPAPSLSFAGTSTTNGGSPLLRPDDPPPTPSGPPVYRPVSR